MVTGHRTRRIVDLARRHGSGRRGVHAGAIERRHGTEDRNSTGGGSHAPRGGHRHRGRLAQRDRPSRVQRGDRRGAVGRQPDRELRHDGAGDQDRRRGEEFRRDALPGRAQEERQADEPGGAASRWGRRPWRSRTRGWRPASSTRRGSASAWGRGSRRWTSASWSARSPGGSARTGRSTWASSRMARAESIFPLWLLKHLPNMAAAHISILHHAMGPNNTIVTACAAGTQAVGEAFRLIAPGRRRRDARRRLRQPARPAAAGRLPGDEGGQRLDPARRPRSPARSTASATGSSWARGPPSWSWRASGSARRRQGDDLRRGHRLRLVVRRLRDHPPRARGQGGGDLDDGRAPRGAGRPGRHRLHQRPRHQHPAQRPDGDRRRQAGLRPPGRRRSR